MRHFIIVQAADGQDWNLQVERRIGIRRKKTAGFRRVLILEHFHMQRLFNVRH